jgi:hypothetical protein
MSTKYPDKGKFKTLYWHDNRNKRPWTSGFPWSEEGGIDGAAKAVAKGLASKVQRVHRESNKVEWTIKALPKVKGVKIIPYEVISGDDVKPSRKKEPK